MFVYQYSSSSYLWGWRHDRTGWPWQVMENPFFFVRRVDAVTFIVVTVVKRHHHDISFILPIYSYHVMLLSFYLLLFKTFFPLLSPYYNILLIVCCAHYFLVVVYPCLLHNINTQSSVIIDYIIYYIIY